MYLLTQAIHIYLKKIKSYYMAIFIRFVLVRYQMQSNKQQQQLVHHVPMKKTTPLLIHCGVYRELGILL